MLRSTQPSPAPSKRQSPEPTVNPKIDDAILLLRAVRNARKKTNPVLLCDPTDILKEHTRSVRAQAPKSLPKLPTLVDTDELCMNGFQVKFRQKRKTGSVTRLTPLNKALNKDLNGVKTKLTATEAEQKQKAWVVKMAGEQF